MPDTSLPSCPCGSHQPYSRCCGLYHQGAQRLQAPTAEHLMRSRYTAFVLDDLAYLTDTWHPSTRPAALEPNAPGTRWLGLDIRTHWQHDAENATVEFVARVRHNGKATRLHETSRFVKENGQWLYLDGQFSN